VCSAKATPLYGGRSRENAYACGGVSGAIASSSRPRVSGSSVLPAAARTPAAATSARAGAMPPTPGGAAPRGGGGGEPCRGAGAPGGRKQLGAPRPQHGGLARLAEDHGPEGGPQRGSTEAEEGDLGQGEAHEEHDRARPAPKPIGQRAPDPPSWQAEAASHDEHRAHGGGRPAVLGHRDVRREGEARHVVAHGEERHDDAPEQPAAVV